MNNSYTRSRNVNQNQITIFENPRNTSSKNDNNTENNLEELAKDLIDEKRNGSFNPRVQSLVEVSGKGDMLVGGFDRSRDFVTSSPSKIYIYVKVFVVMGILAFIILLAILAIVIALISR